MSGEVSPVESRGWLSGWCDQLVRAESGLDHRKHRSATGSPANTGYTWADVLNHQHTTNTTSHSSPGHPSNKPGNIFMTVLQIYHWLGKCYLQHFQHYLSNYLFKFLTPGWDPGRPPVSMISPFPSHRNAEVVSLYTGSRLTLPISTKPRLID